jgi:hypothetical protein
MSRARLAWLFGWLLVLAGFLPVVLFALGPFLPGADLGAFPDLSWVSNFGRWLSTRRIRWVPSTGLLYALLGLAAMYLGAALARAQEEALDALRFQAWEARRRKRQYGPMQRIEPTLGPAD